MSIVAYTQGVLAADRLLVDSWDHRIGEVTKIFRTKDALYGAVGNWGDYGLFFEWARAGFSAEKRPAVEEDFSALKIDASGVAITGKRCVFQLVEAPYVAIGSGCHLAIGAMACGASADEAVQYAIDHVTSCGGSKIDIIRIAEQANQYRPEPVVRSPVDDLADIHFGGPRL